MCLCMNINHIFSSIHLFIEALEKYPHLELLDCLKYLFLFFEKTPYLNYINKTHYLIMHPTMFQLLLQM